jgi:hypothetical protein
MLSGYEEEAKRLKIAVTHRYGFVYNIDPEDCPLRVHIEREEWMILTYLEHFGPKCEECRKTPGAEYHPCQPDDAVSWEEKWRRRGFIVEWSDAVRSYVITEQGSKFSERKSTVQKVDMYINELLDLRREQGHG